MLYYTSLNKNLSTRHFKEQKIVTKYHQNAAFKQGRIHGYPSRVRVGRGIDGEGHCGIWAGAVSSKRRKRKMGTDRQTDGWSDGQSGV